MAERKTQVNYDNMPRFHRGGGGPGRFAPTEKPKNARGTLLRLMKIFLKWRAWLLAAAVLTVASASVSLLTPLLLGRAINTFDMAAGTVDGSLLRIILISLLLCYLANWLLSTVSGALMANVTQRLVKSMRTELFRKLQSIPLGFYDTRPHGDTMSRITNDVDNISNTIAQTTTQLISSAFSIVGALVMMMVLSPPLTLVAMITIPLFTLLTRTITRRSRVYFLGQQRKLGQLNGIVEENIVGLKMVKAFNLQDKVLADFKAVNAELREYSTKAQIWSGFLMPFMNVINNLSFGLIACIGGALSIGGSISVGVVVSFLTYSKQFGQPLNNVAGMLNTIQAALAGAERIFEIMDEREEALDKCRAVELTRPAGRVEFRDVSFSYIPGKEVLRHVSFTVNPGDVVALVGETGAGKTTIVNLLTRFYEVDRGEILIDGTNITDISRKSLRECFSVVLQDTCLFTDTIMNNIRYSRPEAADEEVVAAARLSHAHDFIARLPRQYETMLTGSADNLSQGQRQLLAIARAILCDAPILILDEATSSVDTKTEKDIQHAMLTLMKNRTCFLIAHRLSTIVDSDRIMVIGDGEIMEAGTHRELMAAGGPYYEMVVSQMGSGQSEGNGARLEEASGVGSD